MYSYAFYINHYLQHCSICTLTYVQSHGQLVQELVNLFETCIYLSV